MSVPQEPRPPSTVSTSARGRLTRIYIPLAHRTQSVVVNVQLELAVNEDGDPQPLPSDLTRLYVLAHHPNDTPLTFEKGSTVASFFPGRNSVSLVPSSDKVYTLWSSRTRALAPPQLKIKVHSLIFDLPTKLVATTYHKLYQKMGSLQSGGLLYLRLMQSLANTLLFSLRFQQDPEPGWKQILNEARIPYELPHIQVLGEIVTWVEEDLTKLEEQPQEVERKPTDQHREELDDPIQIRRRQRRRLMMRDRAHFRGQDRRLPFAGVEPPRAMMWDNNNDEQPQIRRDRQLAQQLHQDQLLRQRHVAERAQLHREQMLHHRAMMQQQRLDQQRRGPRNRVVQDQQAAGARMLDFAEQLDWMIHQLPHDRNGGAAPLAAPPRAPAQPAEQERQRNNAEAPPVGDERMDNAVEDPQP